MYISRSAKRSILLFTAGFLLCGIVHLPLPGLDYTNCITQLYCSMLLLIWALSVQERVTDRRLRSLLLWAAGFVLLFFILQIIKYDLVSGDAEGERHTWYAYYIAMLGAVLCCFYVALAIHRPPQEKLGSASLVPAILCLLLILGILTNDRHGLAFRFPEGDLLRFEEHSFGPLIYLAFGYLILAMAASFFIILKKCRYTLNRGYRLLPALPVLLMLLYLLLNARNRIPRYHGLVIWNIGEVFGFAVIGFLESCIQLGLIPANREYERLFRLTALPAVILDRDGGLVEKTAGAQDPFPGDEDLKIMEQPVVGGSIRWAVDLRPLRELNEQLEEATRQMEARNAYLAAENKTQKEKTELMTRNRLFVEMIGSLRPQLEQINRLLDEADLSRQLPLIAILCVYVKRRSNMELLAQHGDLSTEELVLAVRESMEYAALCGVRTAVNADEGRRFPAAVVTAAYEAVEAVLESSLGSLTDMMAVIRADGACLTLRMLLQAREWSWEMEELPPVSGQVSREGFLSRDGQESVIALRFAEGGR